ncbi:MAG: transcription factor S [Candidatus Aenigmarchaeota archaeon]|nr:transcription factor S [Candidatus Aenigmarchaeota archaeon]
MVMTCPKCGSLMIPKKDKNGKTILVCRRCGYKMKNTNKKIRIGSKIKEGEKEVIVLEKREINDNLPKTHVICPKCGNDEAYWWMQQTRSADEPPTIFYKCTKCGYQWRSYG